MFIINIYVYKVTCMIQCPCPKHASSPSLLHQAMLVYTCLLFICSVLSLTTLILGERGTEFLLQNVPTVSYKIVVQNDALVTIALFFDLPCTILSDESIEAWNSYDHYFKIGQVLYEQQWPFYLFQQNDSTWRQLANQYLHCCLSLSRWKFQLDHYSKELWWRTLLWNTVNTLQLPYILGRALNIFKIQDTIYLPSKYI